MEKVNEMISVQETKAKKRNKGFSLVELIIVIAIMAILVGVVGTQVLPYMDKSRKAKDMQVVSAVCTAAVTTFAEHAADLGAQATYTYTYTNSLDQANDATNVNDATDINAELKSLLGVASGTNLFTGYFGGATATSLSSKSGKTATTLVITYTPASGAVSVKLTNGTNDILDPVTSK